MSQRFHWSGAAHLVLAAAERLGVDKSRVLDRARLKPGDIPPRQGHIEWSVLNSLTSAALELSGEPGLGLLAGKLGSEHPNGIGRAYFAQLRTPRDAQLFAYAQVFPQLTHVMKFRIEEAGDLVLGRGEPISPVEPNIDVHMQLLLVMHVGFYRGIFGEQIGIDHVAIRSTTLGDAAHLSELAGCRVLTDQAGDWVAVPRSLMDRSMPMATGWLRDQLRPQLDAFLHMLEEGRNITLAIRSMVEEAFGRGLPVDLDRAAARLGLRPRTLRARLRAEGTTFTAIVDTFRKEHALRLVANPGVKLAAVAAQVGFSDSAVFTRAFRRWTGCTPTVWQEQSAERRMDNSPLTAALR